MKTMNGLYTKALMKMDLWQRTHFKKKHRMRRNIVEEAWDISVTKRLRSNSHLNTLRGYVQVNDYLWCELVAIANYRAEEIRSQKLSREFDEGIARQYFEQNPFLISLGIAREVEISITFDHVVELEERCCTSSL